MRIIPSTFILLLALLPIASYAEGTSVTARAGTLGLGVEVSQYFTPKLSGRLGLNRYSYDFSDVDSGIDYDYELDLSTVSLLLDWHPMENGFYFSAGFFSNSNELNSVAKANQSLEIGGNTYQPADIGRLKGKVDFDSAVPYLGLGWSRAFDAGTGFSVNFDVGVLFQGSADVTLTAETPQTLDPLIQAQLDADLQTEEAELENELDGYEHYPVISLGLTYQF